MTQLLLQKASLPSREIEEAAEWTVKTIVRCTGVSQAKIDAMGRKKGRATLDSAT